jgi:hypothetical protein
LSDAHTPRGVFLLAMTRSFPIVVLGSIVAALVLSTAARASCIPATETEQRERAEVIFDGVALEGPTESGRQQFRVERYLKGSGADLVPVATGVTRNADGTGSVTSVSVNVAAGERWRIYGRVVDGAVETSVCAGSMRLAAREAPPATANDRRAAIAAAAALILAVGVMAAITRRRRLWRALGG